MTEIQKKIKSASSEARKWFVKNSLRKSREVYFAKGKLCDQGNGAVYIYYKDRKAVYVGESSRPIKRRMHDQKSPHKKQSWWKEWTAVRFINIPERTDRLTLELLLILAYKPENNVKPGPRKVEDMFKT